MQQIYIESTSVLNWDTYIWPPLEQISLLNALSDYIIKVMKPMYDMPEANITLYAISYPNYKEKSGMTKSVYKLSLLWPPSQLLLPPATSFNYIIKVMKLLYNIQKANIT